MIKHFVKATVATLVTPIDIVVDVCNIHSDKVEGKGVFHRTTHRLNQAYDSLDRALSLDDSQSRTADTKDQ